MLSEWADANRILSVSIRARPIGRAMRVPSLPRPVPRPVSIRARPIGRAMRRRACSSAMGYRVSIRARPIGRAMPRPGRGGWVGRWFQSAPGQLAGRCRLFRYIPPPIQVGFNPRPANWPGDAHRQAHKRHPYPRFNPRPANWPGDAVIVDLFMPSRAAFQSAPGQLAGRCPTRAKYIKPVQSFNPRPANWPGDAQRGQNT